MTTRLAATLLASALSFACGDDGGVATDAPAGDGVGVDASTDAAIDPESAAGLGLVQIYAGTYNVTATVGAHQRGTVTVSGDGMTIDFDTGMSFAVDGNNVYNRIPNFPTEPRVQIEFLGTPQTRIRIYVDPANKARALRFVYYASATTEDPTVSVNVVP